MISLFKKNTEDKNKKIFSKMVKNDINKKLKRPLNQYFIYK
jgi:hypothetical protein